MSWMDYDRKWQRPNLAYRPVAEEAEKKAADDA